jgi:hypothetical protein
MQMSTVLMLCAVQWQLIDNRSDCYSMAPIALSPEPNLMHDLIPLDTPAAGRLAPADLGAVRLG